MLKQYKEAIEKSNIISKTDTNGIITFVNDEFCKISGYSKQEKTKELQELNETLELRIKDEISKNEEK